MPELPEVEVARRNLDRWLRGRTIEAAHFGGTRLLRTTSARALRTILVGQRVRSVERRGKWLRVVTASGAVYSHLGMTGKWVRRRAGDDPQRFERATLLASGGVSLRYLDPRLFGRFDARASGDLPEWSALGVDPLLDGLDGRALAVALDGARGPVKVALLDQERVAGVGNIQATEALWRARLHPERRADQLSAVERTRLARGILGSIRDTLEREEGPEIIYVEEAGAENPFAIYGRGGEPCPRCGATLLRTVLGGRGTVHCPRCQR